MFRKVAVGCLAVVALLVVGGGAVLYFQVLRPAGNVVAATQSLSRIQELDGGVRNRAGFEPPADGLLTSTTVERYLGVQQQVSASLEGKLRQIEAKYDEMEGSDRDPNLAELAGAWADVMNLLVEAKEAQVAALNDSGFSLEEYAWVRSSVMHAAGYAVYGYDLSAVLSGAERAEAGRSLPVPAANVELLEPYREQLEEFLPLAYFGL